jgi:DNA-binding NtrC family response regulator
VLRVRVPALRERLGDVPLLARAFLPPGATLDEKTLARFAQHSWPGNVRELRNAVERVLAGAEPLRAAPSTPAAAGVLPGGSLEQPFLVQKERLVADFERAYLKALLAACGGNLAEGARRAGVSRMAVVKLMTRHGLL